MNASPNQFRRGFTLVEMLTAMAIFVIMISFLGQLISNTTTATNASKAKLSADDQARFALDRIGEDLQRLSKRSDLDYMIGKKGGNDDFYFYSEVPGLGVATLSDAQNQSGVSLIGYRINSDSKLERYSESIPWTQLSFLSYDSNNAVIGGTTMSAKMSSLDSAKYHVLCDGVFRLEIAFLLRDGTYSFNTFLPTGSNLLRSVNTDDVDYRKATGTGGPTVVVGRDSSNRPIYRGLGWKDVSAVIVSLVVVDESGRKMLSNSGVAGLANKFSDMGTASELPMKSWEQVIETGLSSGSSVPKKAVSGLRVYQRTFFLSRL